MAERVGRERIQREDGYLYYLGKDGYIWKTPTRLNVNGRKARVGTERFLHEEGYVYFLDKAGFVSRARLKGATAPAFRSAASSIVQRPPTVIHTIERQVVKIRCRHCGSLVNEVEGKCPSCGAPL